MVHTLVLLLVGAHAPTPYERSSRCDTKGGPYRMSLNANN